MRHKTTLSVNSNRFIGKMCSDEVSQLTNFRLKLRIEAVLYVRCVRMQYTCRQNFRLKLRFEVVLYVKYALFCKTLAICQPNSYLCLFHLPYNCLLVNCHRAQKSSHNSSCRYDNSIQNYSRNLYLFVNVRIRILSLLTR